VMKKVRDGEMSLTREITDVILQATDTLKVLLAHVKARDGASEDIADLLKALEAAAEGKLAAPADAEPARSSEPDEMDLIIDDFVSKVETALSEVDDVLSLAEDKPLGGDSLHRAIQSLAGIEDLSGTFGYDQVHELSRRLKAILVSVQQGLQDFSQEVRDVVDKALMTLKVVLGHVKGRRFEREDIDLLCVVMESAARGIIDQAAGTASALEDHEPEPVPPRIGEILVDEGTLSREALNDALEEQQKERKLGEILVDQGVPPEAVDRALDVQKKSGGGRVEKEEALNIRVDVKRLDSVMNLVGEMVLGRNRLTNIGTRLESRYPDDPDVQTLMENLSFISLVTSDLQLAVMKTRMQPVRKVFSKFPRIVRDMSRKLGKEVELEIFGEDTELDKSVIEELGDPLVHLVRNAVDHGLETSEERVKAKKPRTGRISMSASQEGDHILIEITDDGRGMNVDRIRNKAIERGLVSEAEAHRMDEKHVLDFIFMAGFSTAAQQTELSGRGVGMDVVKTHISKLNGYVEASSEKGRGSRIKISLPLTLAIVQALMVRVASQTYALPLSPVNETLKIHPSEVKTIDGRPVITMRGQVIPVVDLASVFNLSKTESRQGAEDVYLVVVSLGDRRFAIMVDRLLGKEEVVIKNMKGLNAEREGIAGATITGDGRVVLIVDLTVLLRELMGAAMG